MMGSSGDGDMKHVSGYKLWRSHGGTCEISQQCTEGPSICHPGTVHQVQTGWGRDSLAPSLGLSVPLGWDSYLLPVGSQTEIPPLMVCGYWLLLTECFRRCFLIRVWHARGMHGSWVSTGGGGRSQLAGARQQKEAGWILVPGYSRRADFEDCGRAEWCCMMD